jgi:hypothetical protein
MKSAVLKKKSLLEFMIKILPFHEQKFLRIHKLAEETQFTFKPENRN